MIKIVILCRPHLMLAYARGDDRLALRQLVKQPDGVLRLDRILRVLKTKRKLRLPLGDLRAPLGVEVEPGRFPLETPRR
jgi:hypothetical protein